MADVVIDDVGALRLMPNLTIVAPGDLTELATLHRQCRELDGPVYTRLGLSCRNCGLGRVAAGAARTAWGGIDWGASQVKKSWAQTKRAASWGLACHKRFSSGAWGTAQSVWLGYTEGS